MALAKQRFPGPQGKQTIQSVYDNLRKIATVEVSQVVADTFRTLNTNLEGNDQTDATPTVIELLDNVMHENEVEAFENLRAIGNLFHGMEDDNAVDFGTDIIELINALAGCQEGGCNECANQAANGGCNSEVENIGTQLDLNTPLETLKSQAES